MLRLVESWVKIAFSCTVSAVSALNCEAIDAAKVAVETPEAEVYAVSVTHIAVSRARESIAEDIYAISVTVIAPEEVLVVENEKNCPGVTEKYS